VPAAVASHRSSPVAEAIRTERLVVVLRRVAPRSRLLDLVDELAEDGAKIFEITFDASDAAEDVAAVRTRMDSRGRGGIWVGAGTLRTVDQVARAAAAGAAFGVSPILDRAVLDCAGNLGLPFVPGAFTPTEVDAAWRFGATFVKLFPGSSVGPAHVREIRAPMPEIELIPTGGIDASNAVAFLAAGATAVGIGSAIVRATPAERRAIVAAIAAAPRP
jgi:2-dehydro-3-deoxyphosphogluconate aldolase/(4S)-4-hydroxy-2-oxoglutarate aldolase